MQSKVYTFEGNEYTVQRNVLMIANAFSSIQYFYESMLSQLTNSIENDEVKEYKKKLDWLKKKSDKDEADLLKADKQEAKEVILKQIENNKENLKILNDELESNEILSQWKNANEQVLKFALTKTITNYELVKEFLKVYLIGDLEKLDFTNSNITTFISEVMMDFFSSLQRKESV